MKIVTYQFDFLSSNKLISLLFSLVFGCYLQDLGATLLAQNSEANIVVLGDLNEFQFNTPLSALKGGAQAELFNLLDALPLHERYTYIFDGNAQALDHILVSPALAGKAEFDVVHVNAEFDQQASDHDPLVAAFDLGRPRHKVRFATFNTSLNRLSAGELISNLSGADNAQAKAVAEIIQRNAPDILLLNEFDYDTEGAAIELFKRNYLEKSQNGAAKQFYPHVYLAPSNTGVQSGVDLDGDGNMGGPGDAYGFGFYPGQFGMVLLSKYPIMKHQTRTFQHFRWTDMPDALLPDDVNTSEPNDWYSEASLSHFRLSSKSHWDIPINIHGKIVHILASHPTPPVFDGPEDRNGKRNHDEIRFWADYINPEKSTYIYDDRGHYGGLKKRANFVIMGDLNADPADGDSVPGAIQQLLANSAVNTRKTPVSKGAVEAAILQNGANDQHLNTPDFDTADFSDSAPGNLRVDYVLPSYQLNIYETGVYWPLSTENGFNLVGNFPFPASDHRLVWVDIYPGEKYKRRRYKHD